MSFVIQIPEGSSITLPNPELGDKQKYDNNAVIRHTRAGDLCGCSHWFGNDIRQYKFTTLSKTLADNLKTFLETNAGIELYFSSIPAYGFILTQIPEVIVLRDDCWYDIELEILVVEMDLLITEDSELIVAGGGYVLV